MDDMWGPGHDISLYHPHNQSSTARRPQLKLNNKLQHSKVQYSTVQCSTVQSIRQDPSVCNTTKVWSSIKPPFQSSEAVDIRGLDDEAGSWQRAESRESTPGWKLPADTRKQSSLSASSFHNHLPEPFYIAHIQDIQYTGISKSFGLGFLDRGSLLIVHALNSYSGHGGGIPQFIKGYLMAKRVACLT